MDNANHYRYIEAAIVALSSVSKALIPSLGPCGRDALITTKTGQILITNNGGTILSSVEIEHPGVRIVLDAATNFLNATGDGSKMFFIFSSTLLSHMVQKCEKHRFSQSITELRRVVTKIRQSLVKENTLQRELSSISCVKFSQAKEKDLSAVIKAHIKPMLNPILQGRFSSSTVTQFIQLITQFMDLLSKRDIHVIDVIRTYRKCSPVVKIPGASLGQSVIFSGHLLTQIPTRPRLMNLLGRGSLRAIILRCTLLDQKDSIFQGAKFIQEIDSVDQSSSNQVIRENIISKMVSLWLEKGIKLVMSTFVVDDMVSDICERNGIAVIQCIEDDDADQIAVANNTHPINYEETLKSAELDRHIFTISSVALISAGGSHFFQLNYHTSKSCFPFIILRAQSTTLLDQYWIVLRRCFVLLESFASEVMSIARNPDFNEYSKQLTVPACFASEIHFASFFKRLANHQREMGLGAVDVSILQSISSAYEDIVIYALCNIGPSNATLWRREFHKLSAISPHRSNEFLGVVVDGVAGMIKWSSCQDASFLELSSNKSGFLFSALEVCEMFLRIDAAVECARLPSTQDDANSSDDE